MIKLPNWKDRLGSFIASNRGKPFEWGYHDCSLFAANAIQSMTGIDPAPEFRDKYKDRRGAYRVLKSFYGNLEETLLHKQSQFGWHTVKPLKTLIGDIVLIRQNGFWVMGVHTGTHVAVAGDRCVENLPISRIERAWRIRHA